MKKSYFLSVRIFLVLYCSFITISCNNEIENKRPVVSDSLAKENEQALIEADKLIKTFPSPIEVTNLLCKAGAKYIQNIPNSCENSTKYETIKSRAFNMGVYGADLCYAATYDKKQETTNFLVATQKIILKLEIPNCFDIKIMERFNKNLNNKDSIINLLTKQFTYIYESLNNTGRSKMSVLSVSGATIEGLFLTTQLSFYAKDNKELRSVIFSQKDNLKKLSALLSLYENDTDVADIAEKVKKLNSIFDNSTETLTNEQLMDLCAQVEMTRNKLVKP